MADIDVWPIPMLLMADMVFCVADMVVADVVCGRYRRFPIGIRSAFSVSAHHRRVFVKNSITTNAPLWLSEIIDQNEH